MGEIAGMMLDGTLCQGCGKFIGEGDGDGVVDIPSLVFNCTFKFDTNGKLVSAVVTP